jgi:hypothetical protein
MPQFNALLLAVFLIGSSGRAAQPSKLQLALDPNCPALLKRVLSQRPRELTKMEKSVAWAEWFGPESGRDPGPITLAMFLAKEQRVFIIEDRLDQSNIVRNLRSDVMLGMRIRYWTRMENIPLLATVPLTAVMAPLLWYLGRPDVAGELLVLPFASLAFKFFAERREDPNVRATRNEIDTRLYGFYDQLGKVQSLLDGMFDRSFEQAWLWHLGHDKTPEALVAVKRYNTSSETLLMIRNY